jgi:hypothetical protein
MTRYLLATAAMAVAFASPAAAIQRTPYAEIKVDLAEPLKPEPALQAAVKSFAVAVARKDTASLLNLLAPSFVWTFDGQLAEEFDMGRGAGHNFKVAFGFRMNGKDVDGGVEDGPYWETLASFANAGSLYKEASNANLVCGPSRAWVADEELFAKVRNKLETKDDSAEWFFVPGHAGVMSSPTASGPPIATINRIAVPVLSYYPKAASGQFEPTATHIEVLLPSGKTGFISIAAAKPLYGSRLCFAKTADGNWKIALYDADE